MRRARRADEPVNSMLRFFQRRLEQLADRNPQHGSDLRQPVGADPVCALLVFLDLLKGNADPVGERRWLIP